MNRNRQIKPEMTEFTFEGVTFILGKSALEEPFKPGDMYFGERNSGPKLLTCLEMSLDKTWVWAKEKDGYPYDSWECRKILGIKE